MSDLEKKLEAADHAARESNDARDAIEREHDARELETAELHRELHALRDELCKAQTEDGIMRQRILEQEAALQSAQAASADSAQVAGRCAEAEGKLAGLTPQIQELERALQAARDAEVSATAELQHQRERLQAAEGEALAEQRSAMDNHSKLEERIATLQKGLQEAEESRAQAKAGLDAAEQSVLEVADLKVAVRDLEKRLESAGQAVTESKAAKDAVDTKHELEAAELRR